MANFILAKALLPEIFLSVSMLISLLLSSFKKSSFNFSANILTISLIFCIFLLSQSVALAPLSIADLSINYASIVPKLLIFLISVFVCLLLKDIVHEPDIVIEEIFILIGFLVVSSCLLVGSNNFLMFYLSVELQALSSYVILGLRKNNSSSSEGAIKYFVISAIASCFMLFSISLIYGGVGSINFDQIGNFFAYNSSSAMHEGQAHLSTQLPIIKLGIVMFLASVFVKLGLAPFHFWQIDLYYAMHPLVVNIVAIVPKIAIIPPLLKVLNSFSPSYSIFSLKVLVVVVALSFVVGSFAAVVQKSVKKILAYSATLNVAFAMLPVVCFAHTDHRTAIAFSLYYVAAYAIASVPILVILSAINSQEDNVSLFNGIYKKHPYMAACLAISCLSLAGIPPTLGFFAKYLVVSEAIKNGFYTLAILSLVVSVAAAYIYLRIIKHAYFNQDDSFVEVFPFKWFTKIILTFFAFLSVILFLAPFKIINLIYLI